MRNTVTRKVTAKQKANLKPFKKGFDERRNVNGSRPKSFDELRSLAQRIASENFDDKKTVIEQILETMTKDKRLMKDFLEFAYGKVPLSQIVDIHGSVNVNWKQFIDGSDSDTNSEASSE